MSNILKTKLLVCLGIFVSSVSGQNLIPNPYFNLVPDCKVSPVHDFFEYWYNPTTGSRNIAYHVCLGNIPFQPFGVEHYKYPRRGEGMISILLFSDQFREYKSYIATPLLQSLEREKSYLVRFYISPQKRQLQDKNIVSDVIGMYITSEKVQRDLLTTLPFNPQIEMRGTFFEDFDHWYKIQGKYIADGGERFVVIGNFQSDLETNFKYTNPESGSVPNGADVFVDDVLIEVFNPLSDTVMLCERQDVVLNAGFHDARYAWNTGHRDSVITVSRSGKYRVEATIDSLVFADSTVVLYMDELAQRTELDTFFCRDETMWLQSPAPGQYNWSTGDTSGKINVTEEGLYRLSVENYCGQYEFTYSVFQRDCDCDLILPTAFSPDGDGSNDVFTIIDRCRYSNWNLKSFQVYDKWGGLVYQERGRAIRWNGGDNRGRDLPPGVYTYRMEAIVRPTGDAKVIVRTGTLQLLR